ncbi:MAG: lipopolysaccharide biosynthesis protein, partial [Prevotella sp.]|nr:lipopolysaccharide biosynthesis protein [Prevotella sp.]
MAQSAAQNNKRILKNTMFLYIRMFVIMIVSLFTSRVVLQVLGTSDYGTYNIIGGVVVLFSFINGALTSATQRYLNFYIGKNDPQGTQNVFSMSMNIYILLSVIFLVLAETIGLWFVDTQLNIPPERMNAALWVYQFTVFTFMLNLTRIPYNASLIAYEKMDFYAYLSLLDVILKLVIVYLLYISPVDKLIFYGFLLMMVNVVDNVAYRVYCHKKFQTCHYQRKWDRSMAKELFGFSGWSLFGNLANVGAQQGLNILVNIFYGVTLSAALGIANQVSSYIVQFFTNFQTAFNPQIVKYYASGEITKFFKLIFRASKLSYYLMLLISFPFMLKINGILNLWLVDVPQYTAIFCQLILVFYLLEALAG